MKLYFKYDTEDKVSYKLAGETSFTDIDEATVAHCLMYADGWVYEALRRNKKASSICVVAYDDVLKEWFCYEHDGRQHVLHVEDEIADEIR